MNLITYLRKTNCYHRDACNFGIGVYNRHRRACYLPIPKELQLCTTLDFIQLFASVIIPWIDLIKVHLPTYSCALSLSYSKTSDGCQAKSNSKKEGERREQVTAKVDTAWGHTMRMLEGKVKYYSQWLPGETNDVAD